MELNGSNIKPNIYEKANLSRVESTDQSDDDNNSSRYKIKEGKRLSSIKHAFGDENKKSHKTVKSPF